MIDNEAARLQVYLRQVKPFDAGRPSTLAHIEYPKMPQVLQMVNQTVSILNEPEKAKYLRKKIVKYNLSTSEELQIFNHAVAMYDSLTAKKKEKMEKLTVQQPSMSLEYVTNQTRLFLRIARAKGIDMNKLVDQVYSEAKKLDADSKRDAEFKSLDEYYACTESS